MMGRKIFSKLVGNHVFVFLSVLNIAPVVVAKENASSTSVGNNFCPKPNLSEKLSIKNDPDEPLVDLNREIKDFGTKFVVKEFFTSEDTLFNFMKLTYQTIDNDLKEYREKNHLDDRAIFFLFKGGNVMRIIANNVFSMLPEPAREHLKNAYQDIFTRSDADFSVFIDDKRLNKDFDKVLKDLTEITYESLNKIRNEFSANPRKYFNLMQLDSQASQPTFEKYLDSLKDVKATSDKENPVWFNASFKQMRLGNFVANDDFMCPYYGQRDLLFEFGDKSQSLIEGSALTDRGSWIQNSLNRTLGWPSERDPTVIVKFHLVRAKVAFEYYYNIGQKTFMKAVGGELIDVSFPHKDDFRLRQFLDNFDSWVSDYTLALDATNERLKFKAESIEGIAADIWDILFEQQERPWKDAKYEKRINRLFFFGIVELLGTLGLGSAEITTHFDKVEEQILTPLKSFYPLKANSEDIAANITQATAELEKANPQLVTINRIWRGLAHLVDRELIKKPVDDDEEKLKALIEIFEKNIHVIKELAKMPATVIEPKKAYDAKMEHLL